jgi:hypothetical protein
VIVDPNLSLLTEEGLDRRIAEISQMLEQYKKASHAAALQSAQKLRQQLLGRLETHQIAVNWFVADVTDGQAISAGLAGTPVDLVITDVPYGRRSAWQITDLAQTTLSPVGQMLEALLPVLSSRSVVAIAADKQQALEHQSYRRLDRFQVGKRRVGLLQPMPQ